MFVLSLILLRSLEVFAFSTGVFLELCPDKIDANCLTKVTPNSGFLSQSYQSETFLPGNTRVISKFSGFAQAYAFYGTLGAIATLDLVDYRANSYSNGQDTEIAAQANALFEDTITITTPNRVPRPGFFNAKFDLHGILENNFTDIPGHGALAGLFAGKEDDDGHFVPCIGLFPDGDSNLTCSFPIVLNKPFDFFVWLGAGVFLDDDPARFPDPYSYSGKADFYNTATLTDILVTDDSGNPIPGISIEADSQTGYPLSGLNQVPEPQSLFLVTTGLIGLVGYGWRKKRHAA